MVTMKLVPHCALKSREMTREKMIVKSEVMDVTRGLLGRSLLAALRCCLELLAETESRGMLSAVPRGEFYAQRGSTCHAQRRKAKQKCSV